jgi:hypothetical protein
MTQCFRLPAVAVAASMLGSIAMTAPAQAQIRIDKERGGRIVAIAGLPASAGCLRSTSTGRVVDRSFERGEPSGFTFNESAHGDSYINLPASYDIKDRAAYARVRAAFDDLLRPGTRLRVGSVACGAAGRIVKLVSATLLDEPPAATAPTAPAPAAPAALPPPAAAQAPASAADPAGSGPSDALLRAPPGSESPAAAMRADQPPPPPASPPAAARPAPPAAANADGRSWIFSGGGRTVRAGVVDGSHFSTLFLDCRRGSGRVTVTVNDAPGLYRRGSRQRFTLAAGREGISVAGPTVFNDMDELIEIAATVSLAQVQDVLMEIARQSRFSITAPGGSMSFDIRGAGEAIPKFLGACAGRA